MWLEAVRGVIFKRQIVKTFVIARVDTTQADPLRTVPEEWAKRWRTSDPQVVLVVILRTPVNVVEDFIDHYDAITVFDRVDGVAAVLSYLPDMFV